MLRRMSFAIVVEAVSMIFSVSSGAKLMLISS